MLYGGNVGKDFPTFTLNGVNGDNEIKKFESYDIKGWTVFYFYPKDFTFICPTEIAEMDRLVDEGINVFGFSGDNEFCKLNWKKANGQIREIRHSLLADTGLNLSHELDIVHEDEGVCLRATFIVDPKFVIQHASVNALDTGRSVNEVIRTVKALQAGGLTGCQWNPGDDFVA